MNLHYKHIIWKPKILCTHDTNAHFRKFGLKVQANLRLALQVERKKKLDVTAELGESLACRSHHPRARSQYVWTFLYPLDIKDSEEDDDEAILVARICLTTLETVKKWLLNYISKM